MNKQSALVRWLLGIVGLGLIGYAAYGLYDWLSVTHESDVVISSEVVEVSVEKPGETEPKKSCDEYVVPADQPRQIELPSIGKKGCIQQVGVDQNQTIAVPTNIHLAGWYTGSVLPGEEGVSIIDGHVLGRYNDAIFSELDKLSSGDLVRVQFGDMSWKEFVVDSKDMYSIEKTAQEQFRQIDGIDRQLTLITCGGEWLKGQETYDQRVVLRTKLID